MGAADVVPGVSGGTIAFITGIYQHFIAAIKSFDLELLRLLFRGDIAGCWKHVNAALLLPLFLGIITAIATLVRLITHLLSTQPIALWSFFGGLIIASAMLLTRELGSFDIRRIFWLLLGAAVVSMLSLVPVTAVPINPVTIFVAGSIAICAMLLPGISGSFILLILGFYQVTIIAVREFDIAYLAVFLCGAGTGFLVFSRAIHWLLSNFRKSTLATMVGFLFGSLVMIWPWKRVISLGEGIERYVNIGPESYAHLIGPPQMVVAICSFLVGLAIVVILDSVASRANEDQSQ